jgi:hypothetical protein
LIRKESFSGARILPGADTLVETVATATTFGRRSRRF